MGRLIPIGIFVAYWTLGIAQLWAFAEGVEVWLGWGALGAVFLFVVLSVVPVAQLAIPVIGFIGCTRGWGWEWWQALLLVAPFALLSLGMSAANFLASRSNENRTRRYGL